MACPHCGETFDRDDEYIDDNDYRSTCRSCGFVRTQFGFTHSALPVQAPHSTGQALTASDRNCWNNPDRIKESLGLKNGRADIKRMTLILDCSQLMQDEALKLYERVFKHPLFNKRFMPVKQQLAASCMYITCRMHSWPVSISDISKLAHCTLHQLSRWKEKIVKAFKIEIKSVDLLELASSRCLKAGLDANVGTKAVKILKLCRDLCVLTGRYPDNLIVVASYIAWLSQDPIKRRLTTLALFCRKHKFSCTENVAMILKSIAGIMCRLAGEIPWVIRENVSIENVSLHIDDILSYQTILFDESKAKYFTSAEQSAEDNQGDDVGHQNETSCEEIVGSSIDTNLSPTQIAGKIIKVNSKPCTITNNSTSPNLCKTLPIVPSDVDSNINSRVSLKRRNVSSDSIAHIDQVTVPRKKRAQPMAHFRNLKYGDEELFAGKRVVHKQKHKSPESMPTSELSSHPDLDALELGSNDIPDCDFHMYLIT